MPRWRRWSKWNAAQWDIDYDVTAAAAADTEVMWQLIACTDSCYSVLSLIRCLLTQWLAGGSIQFHATDPNASFIRNPADYLYQCPTIGRFRCTNCGNFAIKDLSHSDVEALCQHNVVVSSDTSRDVDLGARPFPGHSSTSRHPLQPNSSGICDTVGTSTDAGSMMI